MKWKRITRLRGWEMTKRERRKLVKSIIKEGLALAWKYGSRAAQIWLENELKKLEK